MMSGRTITRFLGTVAFGALLLLIPPALAHAFLHHATPAAGSTLHTSPPEVALRFSEKLEPSFSTAHVVGPDGAAVGEAAKVDADATLLRVKLPQLAPGAYKVAWHAVSIDSHVTDGGFTFTVVP
jgi:methionine-rich copper-binding protein CopC